MEVKEKKLVSEWSNYIGHGTDNEFNIGEFYPHSVFETDMFASNDTVYTAYMTYDGKDPATVKLYWCESKYLLERFIRCKMKNRHWRCDSIDEIKKGNLFDVDPSDEVIMVKDNIGNRYALTKSDVVSSYNAGKVVLGSNMIWIIFAKMMEYCRFMKNKAVIKAIVDVDMQYHTRCKYGHDEDIIDPFTLYAANSQSLVDFIYYTEGRWLNDQS